MEMIDAHYFLLPSQGNIYSMAKLSLIDAPNKVLVASLCRKVYSFEFLKGDSGFLQPTLKEVHFTYIPSGAEIVSIDAFNKSEVSDEFVIGITFIKSSGEPSEETYLNIYSEWDWDAGNSSSGNSGITEFNLDNIAQSCLTLELNFVPYQLYHTDLYRKIQNSDDVKEVVWLLSGNDDKVHMFQEDKLNHCYQEVDVTEHFIEFSLPPSVILWMDVFYCPDRQRRVTAYGCECGLVKLTIVEIWKNEIISSWTSRSEGPISSVRLFNTDSNIKCPPFLNDSTIGKADTKEMTLNLLVTNTLKPSVVYMNALIEGLNDCHNLPESNQFDAVLCSAIADVNMSGEMAILLGTYGQQILTYQLKHNQEKGKKGWRLQSQNSVTNPIHCLSYLDMTSDGAQELIVVTLRGVHIMQHDPKVILAKLMERLEDITFLETNQDSSLPEVD